MSGSRGCARKASNAPEQRTRACGQFRASRSDGDEVVSAALQGRDGLVAAVRVPQDKDEGGSPWPVVTAEKLLGIRRGEDKQIRLEPLDAFTELCE
jgi:hypothetical protein